MGSKNRLIVEELNKHEILNKFEAFEVYRAIKNSNPKIKIEIKKLRKEILNGLSRHDRISGIWFVNLFKKVIESRSKIISLQSLEAAYDTQDKEVIARKLIAHYANYGISIGAILGASGGILGFITAAYATFGEIACLSYFELCLLYDLSVLYERPLDKANNLEVYKLLKTALAVSDLDMSNDKVDIMVDKGAKLIEEKLYKNDGQVLQGLLKNMGASIVKRSSKNLFAKMIPLIGVVSGVLVGITEDFKIIKSFGRRTEAFYKNIKASSFD
ncbi:hypothetical protein HMPREF1982_04309 [Clostridiales bacterium oral taxon 876 str. F0540]|nr:hypothetical protein HMPREF1982_04309 [Clostridiales bacterium oral taxon 876 str. F0540]